MELFTRSVSEAELRDWGTVLGDYEIVPPFQQLGRALFHVDGAQKKEKNITQFANVGIHPGSIWSGTEKLGWICGSSSDHGVVMEFGKVFPFAGVTAVMEIEPGIARGAMDMLGDSQKIERCFFFRGDYEALCVPLPRREAEACVRRCSPDCIQRDYGRPELLRIQGELSFTQPQT